jgi:7-cyano-7-deazaguanine synthase
MLISAAGFLAPPDTGLLVTGIHGGTDYYDCGPRFLRTINTVLVEQSDGRLRLLTPFETWSKGDVHRLALKMEAPLALTYSCEAGLTPCGRCASCRDRAALDC